MRRVLATATSRVMVHTCMRDSVRTTAASSRSISTRPSWASFATYRARWRRCSNRLSRSRQDSAVVSLPPRARSNTCVSGFSVPGMGTVENEPARNVMRATRPTPIALGASPNTVHLEVEMRSPRLHVVAIAADATYGCGVARQIALAVGDPPVLAVDESCWPIQRDDIVHELQLWTDGRPGRSCSRRKFREIANDLGYDVWTGDQSPMGFGSEVEEGARCSSCGAALAAISMLVSRNSFTSGQGSRGSRLHLRRSICRVALA